MSTNKPEVVAFFHTHRDHPDRKGVSLGYDESCRSLYTVTESLIRLSDYEALQAEYEKLRKDSERYQWIKTCDEIDIVMFNYGDSLDTAIDEEMGVGKDE